MNEDIRFMMEIGGAVAAVAIAFATSSVISKRAVKDIEDLTEKADKTATNMDEKLDGMVKENGARDVRIASQEAAHSAHLSAYSVLAGETRNRCAALEGRTTAIEQSTAEMRGDVRALSATTNRIEGKQDRTAAAIEELRRDLFTLVLNKSPRREPGGGGGGSTS